MGLRAGTPLAKALFALACALYVIGVGIEIEDKVRRIGAPDVGWMVELRSVSPTRDDAADAGLRGGGRPLRVNGVPIGDDIPRQAYPTGTRTRLGEKNTIEFETPRGETRAVTVVVRPWRIEDAVYTEGASVGIGLFFFVVGVTTFLLRPYESPSWAVLFFSAIAGGMLTVGLIPLHPDHQIHLLELYFFGLLSMTPAATLHVALTAPVVHRSLLQRPRLVLLLYATAIPLIILHLAGWVTNWRGMLAYSRAIGSGALVAALCFFVARCLFLAFTSGDRVIVQRARILVAGILAGFAPIALTLFLQELFGVIPIDNRFLNWPLLFLVLALARVAVRQELLNARIAVRRAVMYAWAVGILTVLAVVLSTFRSYAVAVLLFPLLYLWPRFDARLNARLYPQRSRFPTLIREFGDRMAESTEVPAVLATLASAPGLLCDAVESIALLFPHDGREEFVIAASGKLPEGAGRLSDEAVVRLVAALRKDLSRTRIAVEPQYSNISEDCLRGFDRLRAELILPLARVGAAPLGVLAVGPRATGDVYETAELDAISTLVQQAVQSIIRIQATERLSARELEFAELKRFFPPQVIDQVMARGGAAELRSQRRPVTVVFVDLRGFTSFSDSVEPEEVMATLAEYHAVMGARIAAFGGTLERFAGDGFMVFFNDPVEQDDHVERAAAMALAMLEDFGSLRSAWQRKGYRIDIGVGIHTGYATCGFIGYEGRRDYGVIGNVTNLAARLSDAAGAGEILISARVCADLPEGYRCEPVGELTLKGFHQAQQAFRLLGKADGASSVQV